MRVLLVSGSFRPMTCGVGDYAWGLATALAREPGVEVAILTSAEAAPGDAAEPFQVFPAVRRWDRSDLPAIDRVLRDWPPDVVHLQYPTQGYRSYLAWVLPLLLRLRGFPVVQTWHEYVPQRLVAAVPMICMGLAAGDVVVVRPAFRARMPGWYRLLTARKRLHEIPNAPTLPRLALSGAERALVRQRLGAGERRLLAFFGFFYENKGLDDLLAILDPERHHLALIGAVKDEDPYQRALVARIGRPPLRGRVTLTGFLPAEEAARILAAADAVVLPFRDGGGSWNTSLKAAALQGTLVLTTSRERSGYDSAANVYYARPGDTAELAVALAAHAGTRLEHPSRELVGPSWEEIAREHLALYSHQRRR